MKRTLPTSWSLAGCAGILLTCCAGTVYAGSPRHDAPTLAPVSLGRTGVEVFQDGAAGDPFHGPRTQRARDSREDLTRIAYKISYVGTLLLTADQVVRSVDSVLDSMKITREDGTRMAMLMEPAPRGFEVMIKISRPLEF